MPSLSAVDMLFDRGMATIVSLFHRNSANRQASMLLLLYTNCAPYTHRSGEPLLRPHPERQTLHKQQQMAYFGTIE